MVLNSTCHCIEPCSRDLYSPVISYSALTDQVIEEILGPHADLLSQKYTLALDTNDRIKKVGFSTSSFHKVNNMERFNSLIIPFTTGYI